jgi:ATP-dependent exoDNAse (exonuclease V) beta subunit
MSKGGTHPTLSKRALPLNRGYPGFWPAFTRRKKPPNAWQRGRYGTAIGRAVHGVLQSVDLATGSGLSTACAAQAAAEGVLGSEQAIEALCRSALDSDIVQHAAQQPHWREVYVGVPHGDQVLEGYIDLLYQDDDGLVVVDYKTDSWRSDPDLDAKVDRYRVQLSAYATAVRDAVGRDVTRAVLLFLSATGAVAREVAIGQGAGGQSPGP